MSDDTNSKPTSHQRVYGRGMFAGLKLAGVENPREFMNKQKMQRLMTSLNAAAIKVYEAMPPAEEITVSDVMQALHKGGNNIRHEVVLGCITTLSDKGLVKEKARGKFSRVVAREYIGAEPDEEVRSGESREEFERDRMGESGGKPDPAPQASDPVSIHPLERLAQLESKVKALQERHAADMAAVTDEIADVALDVGQYVENVKRENQKLAALKDALRGFVN